jgi:hypothetical protein
MTFRPNTGSICGIGAGRENVTGLQRVDGSDPFDAARNPMASKDGRKAKTCSKTLGSKKSYASKPR